MKTLKFKTNINCGGCIAKVTPFLNADKGIEKWNVDTNSAEKILTIQTDSLKNANIIETVSRSGFKIESLA